MCGITGIVAFRPEGKPFQQQVGNALQTLHQRGPDHQAEETYRHVTLGHARLAVIDTSNAGNQPMTDPTGRYTIVFNGEFYNFRKLRQQLEQQGVVFQSQSDTEVLLQLYIRRGPVCLRSINGFFSLAIYDRELDTLFMARDRLGIKPLLYYQDQDKLIFASEMKAMLAYTIPREIDRVSLFAYLQLNYTPAPNSMIRGVEKLLPGHYRLIRDCSSGNPIVEERQYYQIPEKPDVAKMVDAESYQGAQKRLVKLLRESVRARMVSDVPLGAFLSGGIDSSVIATLATDYHSNLQTFSIGYQDEPRFDETEYAELVARKIGSHHTTFKLSHEDLFEHLHQVLDYLDEPFADSSALPVYILSQRTRNAVTVALSGDGADEMFSGYRKHMAEFRARNPGLMENVVKGLSPIWANLPQSRHSRWANLGRQLHRFSEGMKRPHQERYWRWATLQNEEEANYLMREKLIIREQRLSDDAYAYKKRKDRWLRHIRKEGNFRDVLYTDMELVLPNDMLTKVDMMSMANSLEVRTPFLDHRLVNFAFSLPVRFKINTNMTKKILQDAFRSRLPAELYQRPKQGFEVPLLPWFQSELRSRIESDWLQDDFIDEQQVFNPDAIRHLKQKLFSSNPGDTPATVWALIVFQHWWKRYLG